MTDGDDNLPRDAKIIKALLAAMGVESYEPRVVLQFLEIWYRHAVDLLTDAQVYSNHAGKYRIDYTDLKLAIQSKGKRRLIESPPKELIKAAEKRNRIPIPRPTMSLPPEQDTLIASYYHLQIQKNQSSKSIEIQDEEEEVSKSNPNPTHEQRTKLLPDTHDRVSFTFGPRPRR